MSGMHCLPLEGELTIYRAAEVLPTLVAALDGAPQGIELDLSGVTDIDSAGVQLLLAAKHAALRNGGALALAHAGQEVTQTLELLGLLPFFSDPAAIPDGSEGLGDAR